MVQNTSFIPPSTFPCCPAASCCLHTSRFSVPTPLGLQWLDLNLMAPRGVAIPLLWGPELRCKSSSFLDRCKGCLWAPADRGSRLRLWPWSGGGPESRLHRGVRQSRQRGFVQFRGASPRAGGGRGAPKTALRTSRHGFNEGCGNGA